MSVIIDNQDANKISNSPYDSSKRTILIIHGFIEHGQIPWMNRIRHALLTTADLNVIQVDWGRGASIPYEQAVANSRMVGAQVRAYQTNVKFLFIQPSEHDII
ncbi:Pancreatic triacylglycerol lipase [Exaiptasia diaphana]|nr:Pancreatic triacylglycerol lipase [Exaiptasia diaphana]